MKNTDFIPRVLTLKKECCICLEKKRIVTQMIDQPCMKSSHKICKDCIRKIVSVIPISPDNPNICCQYPWEQCEYRYSKKTLITILKEKYNLYVRARLCYKNPDYIIRDCPFCSVKIRIPEDQLSEMGYNVISCGVCLNTVCIDCNSSCGLIYYICLYCIEKNEYTNLYSYNNWFYKNGEDICDYRFKNLEITPEIALEQIIDKFDSTQETELHVKCPVCKISIYKTEACNGIKHCHVEICYSCGKFSEIGKELEDHWSAVGDRGCPRFDNDPFWNIHNKTKCVEGVCYNHEIGSCKVEEHYDSLFRYREFRKKQQMYHHLKSLIPCVRETVIELLPPKLHKYLPDKKIFEFLDKNPKNISARQDYEFKK